MTRTTKTVFTVNISIQNVKLQTANKYVKI